MAVEDSVRKASAVEIEHTGRTVEALEWSSPTSGPTIVIAVDGDVADLVSPVAEQLMDSNRVIGVNLKSAWDAVTVSWWAQDPVVLVAQGDAGKLACDTARLAPGALRALVLADAAPGNNGVDHSHLVVPVLVFHGRESSAETHEQAVKIKGQIADSHLIELDGCSDLPTKNCATALAQSLEWYLAELGKPTMEFSDFAGSDEEPPDPHA